MPVTKKRESYMQMKPFRVETLYAEIDGESPENVFDSHVHEDCEIYINLTGDVSFVVENHIYPIHSGDIIITRPYEYHHCVYNKPDLHKHFCIWFSSAGNEWLFDRFFDRMLGTGNHLVLSPDQSDATIALCHHMLQDDVPESIRYYQFFKLIRMIQNADIIDYREERYPRDITYAVDYIAHHFFEPITVADMAKLANVSLNTLERHFLQYLHVSPSAYIQKKRLSNAIKLLAEGSSVTEAALQSGFADYSNFIALFKKSYGTTPLQYKKAMGNKNSSR